MGKRSRRKGASGQDSAAEANGSPPEDDAAPEPADGAAAPAEEQPKRTLADPRLREVMAYAEEADMLYHLYRWTLLKGGVPSARDWLPREDMPHPDAVAEVFGSWAKFLEYSGLPDSPMLARLRGFEEGVKDVEARGQQVE